MWGAPPPTAKVEYPFPTMKTTRWLHRHQKDPWRREATKQGYRSRSAWKLLELDARFRFLRRGARVVDLGAAPGGWSQVAAERIGATEARPLLVGVDMLDIAPLPGCRFLRRTLPSPGLTNEITALLQRTDVVLSDMLANVAGHRWADHERSLALCRAAEEFAASLLAPNGVFCCKLLRGGDGGGEKEMLAQWQTRFARIHRFKPKSSRSESAEIYLLAEGFRRSD